MQQALIIIHVLVAIAMIAIVLLQRGKGAEAGAGFGAGASSTVFGARGSGNFLTRVTSILATIFFASSLLLAYLAERTDNSNDLLEVPQQPVPVDVPSADSGEAKGGSAADLPPATPLSEEPPPAE